MLGVDEGMQRFLPLILGRSVVFCFSNCASAQSASQAGVPVAKPAVGVGVDGGDALKALDVTYKVVSIARMAQFLGL